MYCILVLFKEQIKKRTDHRIALYIHLRAAILPTIITAPMMPMRLYLGTVLDNCFRITMCMSSCRRVRKEIGNIWVWNIQEYRNQLNLHKPKTHIEFYLK